MSNPYRGTISTSLSGERYTLALTLGALAELESAFAAGNLLELAERFEKGRLSANDVIKILGAGLRGGGHTISDEAVARLHHEGGAAGMVRLVQALLLATFGGADPDRPPLPQGSS